MRLSYIIPLLLQIILPFVHSSRAIPVNVTIDDIFGDEKSAVLPNWADGWRYNNSQCEDPGSSPILTTTCLQEVNPATAFQNTWTGVVINATTTSYGLGSQLNLTFYGTAIYVYHIIPASNPYVEDAFWISFGLDNEAYALHSYTKTSSTQYNQLAYSRVDLTISHHTLGVHLGDPALVFRLRRLHH